MGGLKPVILLFLIFVHFFLFSCFNGFNIFYYLIYNIGLLHKFLLPLPWGEIHVIKTYTVDQIRSDQISPAVVSDSLRPHESQHARLPCPTPTPGVYWDSRPSSQWCHPAISSSVIPFSSCPQSLPASESFPMSQLFAWGGQSTGVSALASFLPKKSQGWSPSEWTRWISLQLAPPIEIEVTCHIIYPF